MPDPSDPMSWPTPRGPWPEVTDLSRLNDHGGPWCIRADFHPNAERDYPGPRHVPWDECRTGEWFIDDARRELDGDPADLSVYAASPYRFGASRSDPAPARRPRMVLDMYCPEALGPDASARISFPVAEALRLTRLADTVTFVRRQPQRVRPGVAEYASACRSDA